MNKSKKIILTIILILLGIAWFRISRISNSVRNMPTFSSFPQFICIEHLGAGFLLPLTVYFGIYFFTALLLRSFNSDKNFFLILSNLPLKKLISVIDFLILVVGIEIYWQFIKKPNSDSLLQVILSFIGGTFFFLYVSWFWRKEKV